MQDVLLVALAKHLSKNLPVLPAGDYKIDETVTLHVKGTVRKGEDSEYTPTVDIPLLPTLALVLEKAGFQRERAKTLLVEAMQEALTADVEGNDLIKARIKDVEAAMGHVRQITGALPKKTRTGATTVRVTVQELEPVPAGGIDF